MRKIGHADLDESCLVLSRTASAILVLALTASVPASITGTTAVAAVAAGDSTGDSAGTSPTTSTVPSYQRALSSPRGDSYYPAQGDPGVDTLHYGLHLTWLRASRTLVGKATIVFRATRSADSFRLDLGEPLRVTSLQVAPADGSRPAARVPYTRPGNDLVVKTRVQADHRYRLSVAYRGTPAPVKAPSTRSDMPRVGWHTNRDGQVWTMQEPFGSFTWYPSNDHPSDKAFYDVTVDAPGNWVGVSNGAMTHRETKDGRTVTRFHNSDPMASYLTTIAIGPYRRYQQTGPRGLPMTYWVPRTRPQLVKPLLQTPAALRWLENRLGRYPFDRVGVVVTPSDSAMETQTMITMGAAGYEFGNRDVRRTIVHELAHAWYGDTVTPSDWRDLWMNEGMATYLDTRWAVAQGWTTWRQWQRQWKNEDGLWRQVYGPPGQFHRHQFAAINVYYCPALMWDRLRLKVGTAEFDRLVRRWVQEHRNTNQSRATLVRWWEQKTGEELSVFFRRWLMSEKSPA